MRRDLGLSADSERIVFWVRVVPMGWSWSVHLIQEAHTHLVARKLPHLPWIRDKRESTDLTTCKLAGAMYIDNFAVFGENPLKYNALWLLCATHFWSTA